MNMIDESLFELALNTPEAERGALLDRECRNNPALWERVERLLAAAVSNALPFAATADSGNTYWKLTAQPATGSRGGDFREAEGAVVVGKYKLLQQIGEGGMGSV
jgi:hypothetical protein